MFTVQAENTPEVLDYRLKNKQFKIITIKKYMYIKTNIF